MAVTITMTTASIPVLSSANKVFGTTELFEMILLHLSPQDLLLSQRVSKEWQAAVKTSHRIQTKLFFRAEKFTDHHRGSALLNPFHHHFLVRNNRYIYSLEDAFEGKASCPHASWRQMFLTSPAIEELQTLMIFYFGEEPDYNWLIGRTSGIRLGDLVEVEKEAVHGSRVLETKILPLLLLKGIIADLVD